jgi:hypothetical protein
VPMRPTRCPGLRNSLMAHPPARVSGNRTPRRANVFTDEWDDEHEHESFSDD